MSVTYTFDLRCFMNTGPGFVVIQCHMFSVVSLMCFMMADGALNISRSRGIPAHPGTLMRTAFIKTLSKPTANHIDQSDKKGESSRKSFNLLPSSIK